MNHDYTVTMGFTLPAGCNEDDLYYKIHQATKHSALEWWIEGDFEDLGPSESEENGCE